jgi:hypothetical protein
MPSRCRRLPRPRFWLGVLGAEGPGDAPVGGVGVAVDAVSVDFEQEVIGTVASGAVRALPAALASVALAVAAVVSSRGTAVLAGQAQESERAATDLFVSSRGRLPHVRDMRDPVRAGVHDKRTGNHGHRPTAQGG